MNGSAKAISGRGKSSAWLCLQIDQPASGAQPGSFACYTQMKNNNLLAMNTRLHIMQAYATEVSVLPDMGKYWVHALIGGTGIATDKTVLGAWKYVCVNTQPKESAANANVSRSIYWPECASGR